MGMEFIQKMLSDRVLTNDAAINLAKVSEVFYGQILDVLTRVENSLERIEVQMKRLEGLELTSQNIIMQEIKTDKEILKEIKNNNMFIPDIDSSGQISNISKDKKTSNRDFSKAALKIKE